MPGQDIFRNLYPQILQLQLSDVDRISQDDPQAQFFWQKVYYDLVRMRLRKGRLEGWRHNFNPFLSIDLDNPFPVGYNEDMEQQQDMTNRANSWLGIGAWCLAEEYYKTSISLAILSHDVVATLQNGANLALCYLAAGDSTNSLNICEDLLSAMTSTNNRYVVSQIQSQVGTTIRMSLIQSGDGKKIKSEIQKLRKLSTRFTNLDESIFRIPAGIFEAINDKQRLHQWRKIWQQTQQMT
jgi:hypothetical protein